MMIVCVTCQSTNLNLLTYFGEIWLEVETSELLSPAPSRRDAAVLLNLAFTSEVKARTNT